jgi:hypothetical protein
MFPYQMGISLWIPFPNFRTELCAFMKEKTIKGQPNFKAFIQN